MMTEDELYTGKTYESRPEAGSRLGGRRPGSISGRRGGRIRQL